MQSVGHYLTGRELLAFQQRASRHIAFSVTEACPLKCAHCIVATVTPSERYRVTLSLDQARAYVKQMPALRKLGVERVSFTGGEPLLASEQLKLLSAGAVAAGMECTVVTACHWAKTPQIARRQLQQLPDIRNWHLSTDRFHEEYLPIEFVLTAVQTALAEERNVLVRMAVNSSPTLEDQRVFDRLRKLLPDNVDIAIQSVSKVGRAENLDIDVPSGNRSGIPCLSTGLVVRYDGTVSPCCSSLIDQREGHPFRYESASEVGLSNTYETWSSDPLLRLIRSVGFEPLLKWVQDEIPDHPILESIPDHPCEICTGLWRKAGTAEMLRARCESEETRRKVNELYNTVFASSASPTKT
jgi:organic radical activating enzyme